MSSVATPAPAPRRPRRRRTKLQRRQTRLAWLLLVPSLAIVALVAMVVWGRFFVLFVQGEGQGHVQSVVLGAMLFVVAVQLAALGIIGDLLASNRVLIQRALERTRRIELKLGVEPSHYEPAERRAAPRDETVSGPSTEEHETIPLGR